MKLFIISRLALIYVFALAWFSPSASAREALKNQEAPKGKESSSISIEPGAWLNFETNSKQTYIITLVQGTELNAYQTNLLLSEASKPDTSLGVFGPIPDILVNPLKILQALVTTAEKKVEDFVDEAAKEAQECASDALYVVVPGGLLYAGLQNLGVDPVTAVSDWATSDSEGNSEDNASEAQNTGQTSSSENSNTEDKNSAPADPGWDEKGPGPFSSDAKLGSTVVVEGEGSTTVFNVVSSGGKKSAVAQCTLTD